MTFEKPNEPEKQTDKEIESLSEHQIWSSFADTDSDSNIEKRFDDILAKVIAEPNVYYLEKSGDGLSIKKRTDNKTVYYTESPHEIDALEKMGVDK